MYWKNEQNLKNLLLFNKNRAFLNKLLTILIDTSGSAGDGTKLHTVGWTKIRWTLIYPYPTKTFYLYPPPLKFCDFFPNYHNFTKNFNLKV